MSYKCSSSYPYLSCRWVNLATCYHSWKVWILYTQRRQLTVLQRQKRTFYSLLVPFNRRLSDSLRGPDLSDIFFVLMCNTLTASLSGFLSLRREKGMGPRPPHFSQSSPIPRYESHLNLDHRLFHFPEKGSIFAPFERRAHPTSPRGDSMFPCSQQNFPCVPSSIFFEFGVPCSLKYQKRFGLENWARDLLLWPIKQKVVAMRW